MAGFIGALIVIRAVCGPGPSAHVEILLPDHTCGMYCWHEIEPGVTDFKSARTIVAENLSIIAAELGDRWQFTPDDGAHVHTVRLEPGPQPTLTGKIFLYPDGVRLGDLLVALGEPDFLIVHFEVEGRQFQGTRYIELYHPNYRVSVSVLLAQGESLSPDNAVNSMVYTYESMERPFYAQRWRGFTSTIQPVYSLNES